VEIHLQVLLNVYNKCIYLKIKTVNNFHYSDAADDYDDLFKSGKMKKKKKSNKLKPDNEDVPSYDPSGSLF
jgi:hypothetical protein